MDFGFKQWTCTWRAWLRQLRRFSRASTKKSSLSVPVAIALISTELLYVLHTSTTSTTCKSLWPSGRERLFSKRPRVMCRLVAALCSWSELPICVTGSTKSTKERWRLWHLRSSSSCNVPLCWVCYLGMKRSVAAGLATTSWSHEHHAMAWSCVILAYEIIYYII